MSKEVMDLRVDLSNPADIRDRLPGIEEIVHEKARSAADAQQEFQTWEALLQKLKALAGTLVHIEQTNPYINVSSEAIDAVVHVVKRAERPIMPIGVFNALVQEGHDVESPVAVLPVLIAAASQGRLQQLQPEVFAPNDLDPKILANSVLMQAVPEAHMGLGGVPPQSQPEAALRVLGSDPTREWTTADIARVLVEQGWMDDTANNRASLASTLSRLVGDNRIYRPTRGRYRVAPPDNEN